MAEIITDLEVLRQKSQDLKSTEIRSVSKSLVQAFPENALGLAAPQIGVKKRAFIAKLSRDRFYLFVNPEVVWNSSDSSPSVESCLSLPGVTKCVSRYNQVQVRCLKIVDLNTKEELVDLRVKDLDAYVIQHEIDHLNGVLIIDLPEVPTREEKVAQRFQRRQEKIAASRQKQNHSAPIKISSKKLEKARRQEKSRRRREKISVEIQERYRAELEGLIQRPQDEVKTP